VRDFGQSLAQFLDVLGRESSEDRFDVLLGFGFPDSERRDLAVPHVFPFAVQFEPFLDRELGEDLPDFERRDRVVVEERDRGEEVDPKDVEPSTFARSTWIRLDKVANRTENMRVSELSRVNSREEMREGGKRRTVRSFLMIRQILVNKEKSLEMKTPKNGMKVFSNTFNASSASPAFGVLSLHLEKKNVHSPFESGNASFVISRLSSGIKTFFSPFESSTVRDFSALNSSAHCR
jgi:hypothetical protein